MTVMFVYDCGYYDCVYLYMTVMFAWFITLFASPHDRDQPGYL